VAFAERSGYGRFRVGETLPPEANVLLARLGLSNLLGDESHLPSPGIVSAWGSCTPHENDFIFSPYGHGWHLDRRRFDESLAKSAVAAGAEHIREARVSSCVRDKGSCWNVALATPAGIISIRARWVLDATGRASWFTHSQGVVRRVYDRLIALVVILDDPEQGDPRTFIEAMPDGWWYVSRLPDDRTIAAFFTDSDLHDLHPGAAALLWDDRLGHSMLAHERLVGTRRVSSPRVIGCATAKASRTAGAGWLALGDAARAIDPLSSQGISWALASGLDTASVVLDAQPVTASARYEAEWEERFQECLFTRQGYYASERRWSQALFWQRRSAEPRTLR
jgi:flavin-dependent dehydrogenase